MLAAVVTASFQHVDEALKISIDISVRMLKRVADARLGRKMNDKGETVTLEQRLHG
jgi:hypothetical protein